MARWQNCWYKTGFDPYTLNKNFLKRLCTYDNGRLRLRWSYDREKWSVERKSLTTVEYLPNMKEDRKRYNPKTQEWRTVPNESYIVARDGYLIIGYLDPRPAPGDWLIHNLQYNDIRRWGGSKEFLTKLTDFERSRDKAMKKRHRDEWKHKASEVYEDLKRRYGESVFVPKQYKGKKEAATSPAVAGGDWGALPTTQP